MTPRGEDTRFCSIRCALLIVVLVTGILSLAHSRVSVAVFPFVESGGGSTHFWMGAIAAERLDYLSRTNPSLEVWDPVLVMNEDSSAWRMESDSLLEAHRARWGWNAAIGGDFTVTGDTIRVRVKLYRQRETGVVRSSFTVSAGDVGHVGEMLVRGILERLDWGAEMLEGASAGFNAHPAYRTYCAGYFFEMRGEPARAVSAYRRSVELDSRFSPAWARLVGLSVAMRDHASAREAVRRGVHAGGDDPVVVAIAASYFIEHENPKKTQRFMERNRHLLNRTAAGLTAMGKWHSSQGMYQHAVAVLSRALASGPGNLETEWVLAQTFFESARIDEAIAILNRLVTVVPGSILFQVTLGSAYRRVGMLTESVRVLERVHQNEPDNSAVLLNLSSSYFDLGWHERALRLIQHAHTLHADLPEIAINMGVLYWEIGDEARATHLFEQADRQGARRQTVLNNQGTMYALRGEHRRAIRAYERARSSGGANETVLYNLGTAYLAAGDLRKASYWFDELLYLVPARIDVRIWQAEIARRMGDREGARLHYRRLLDSAPFNADIVRGLAGVLNELERYEEAAEVLDMHLRHFPANVESRLLLADTYRLMEWYEVALVHYEMLVRDFPQHFAGYFGIGETLYDLARVKGVRRFREAFDNLARAQELEPGRYEPDLFAGLLFLEHVHARDRALMHLNRALGLAPDRESRQMIHSAIKRARQ